MGKFNLLSRVLIIFVFSVMTVSYMLTHNAAAQDSESTSGSQTSQSLEQATMQNNNPCQSEQCNQIIERLQQQRSLLTRELAQIKREIALLRETLSEPGLKEIFAGIGYILGLVGIAFYVHCRKSGKDS